MFKSGLANISCLAATLALAVAGCGGGGGGGGSGTARATFLLTADSAARSTAGVVARGTTGPVPLSDIQSLTVTVTEIELQRCNGGSGESDSAEVDVNESDFDPASVTIEEGGTVRWTWTSDTPHTITSGLIGDVDAGSLFDAEGSTTGTEVEFVFTEPGTYPYFSNTDADVQVPMTGTVNVVEEDGEEGTEDDGQGGHVTVFEGAFDVNVLDLTQLSQVLSDAVIPAGDYCKIRITIEDPRLVLVADPNTVITNVHLTANGRLFIQDHWSVEDGDEVLILIDFGSIHLVDTGTGNKYVLTPQLRCEVSVSEAEVEIEGEIVAIDTTTRIIQVQTDADVIEVQISDSTTISTDDDSDDGAEGEADTPLAFENLAVGQTVEVEGVMPVSGPLDAVSVEVEDDDIDTTTL